MENGSNVHSISYVHVLIERLFYSTASRTSVAVVIPGIHLSHSNNSVMADDEIIFENKLGGTVH